MAKISSNAAGWSEVREEEHPRQSKDRMNRALGHTGLIHSEKANMSEAKAGIDDDREEDEP